MKRALQIFTSALQISLVTIIFSNAIFAETTIIRANKAEFPATYMTDKMGWAGMDIDVIKEICLRANYDYEIVERPFKRSLALIKTGEIHLIPNLSKTEKRSVYMNWLGPIRITAIGLVVLKKDQHLPIKTCDDLIIVAKQKKRKFGYLTGASYSDYFDTRLKNDPALKETLCMLHSNELHNKMLHAGRIIGYFWDDFESQQRIMDQSQNLNQQYDGLVLHRYRIEGSIGGAYIGISKKLEKTHYQKLKIAFQSIKDDGTFAKLHLKWTGQNPAF